MQPATSKSFLETVSDVNDQLSRSGDVRSNIRNALRAFSTGVGSEFAFFADASDSGELHLAETDGLGLSDFRRLESNLGSPFFRQALVERSVVTLSSENSVLDATWIAVAPATAGSRTVGIVGLGFNADLPDLSNVLSLVGSMIAQALRIEYGLRGERERLREENTHLKQELKEKYDFSHIVGNSNAMKVVYEQISQVAKSNATVLLRGESGTGKEMIANAIHYNSLRSKKPFIKINCAAIPET
jgi:transcriptional regulator with GAF, ATPase, and Fis domain